MPETNKHLDEFAAFKRIWFVITILGVLLYYQSHLGLFTIQPNSTLPEGFTAERIELTARSTGRNATEVQKNFGWLVQES